MFENLRADLRHYARYCYGGRTTWKVLPRLVLAHPAVISVAWYRLGRVANQARNPLVRTLLQLVYYSTVPLARVYSGVQIHLKAEVAPGLAILHFGGVVIAPGTRLGPDSLLHHNVSLVAYRDARGPEIGARFYAGTGAVVVDHVIIEDDVTVGAGAVVTKSVPKDAVIAGNPARILRFRLPNEVPSENKTLAKRPTKEWMAESSRRGAEPQRDPGDASVGAMDREVSAHHEDSIAEGLPE